MVIPFYLLTQWIFSSRVTIFFFFFEISVIILYFILLYNYFNLINESAFQPQNSNIEYFTNLFADSQSSGKLANFSVTDFGPQIKKAKVSFGNVSLGIYKRGSRKKSAPIFHDPQAEKEIYQLVADLKFKGHYYASLRNFYGTVLMNFTPADFQKGLLFITFTFNWQQKALKFSFAPWHQGKKCPIAHCQKSHFYQSVPIETASFLAERRIAKKRLGRESEGVNDLFALAIATIQKNWQPTNFKWVAVPELHKCQTACHWKGKKTKKKGWKNHSEKNCSCPVKHDCLRNWHIHMLSTDFLPPKYQHARCGLGTYDNQGSPAGCWDHRAYIVHDIWPYGLVDIKRISHLKIQGKPIKSAEQVVAYLAKYLAKAFRMRQDQALAQKVGLLSHMSIYKFFRVIYGYDDGKPYLAAKVKKPLTSSFVFINHQKGFNQEAEVEFSPCFEENFRLKKNIRQKLKKNPPPENPTRLTDFLKLCLFHSTRSKVKQNSFWKPCDMSDPVWKKGQGWQVHCPIIHFHHTEPLLRWEFEFKGEKAYSDFINRIKPALATLNLPQFTKFQDYQISQADYRKFALQTKLPWNSQINEYEPIEEAGESWESCEWQAGIAPELIYNHVYLKEVRSQISESGYSGLSPEKAAQRYADY
ncbi:MAG: hypothetical protein I3275_03405 [Candidatus Moeniiplasma glomeromycotorum]|nr:hypothetical protein [Candidatus Moeniiplasma glomeromycotorum]